MASDPGREFLDNTRASYDRVAERYATEIAGELAGKPLDRALLACLTEQVGGLGAVADLGCGPGHVAAYLHGLGVPVVGVDLSPEMVAIAKRSFPAIPFVVGSMLELAADDASWGGILAFYSIIHLPPETRPRAFAEFLRVLRPGGLAFLAFHIGDKREHLEEWWGQAVSLDAWFLSPAEIETELRAAGFAIEMSLVRQPYAPDVEYQSQRSYIFARKPAE
jgi:SAM-dependent methyltransferase